VNVYSTLAAFKAEINRSATDDDAMLLRQLERASREVDRECQRHFYSETATRYFDGNGRPQAWIDDLVSVTTVKADTSGAGSYSVTLAANIDYWTWPNNPRANEPVTRLDLNPISSQLTEWPKGRRRIQVVGVFGYSAESELVGTLGAAIVSTSATSITMTAGHGLSAGETIIVGTEQMYISAVATNTLTVVRGVNGTTAATALISASVSRRVYCAQASSAATIRAADLWRGTQTGFSTVAAPEFGGFTSQTAYAAFKGLCMQVARRPMVFA
jgi:hypothetical protein